MHDAAAKRRAAVEGGPVRFHGVGHSLGCHVVAGAICGPTQGPRRLADGGHSMHSLTLIEPAVNAKELQPGRLYDSLVTAPGGALGEGEEAQRSLVAGPIVVTTSAGDRALRWYSFYHGEAMGLAGALLTPEAAGIHMLPSSTAYALAPGCVSNVNGDAYIIVPKEAGRISRSMIGSHCDIYGPEVCHLVWATASLLLPANEKALRSGAAPAAAAPAQATA